jgi:hypothetical protein
MSSLLFFAPFLAFLGSFAIYHLVRLAARRCGAAQFAKTIGFAAAAIAFIPATFLFLEQLPAATTYSGRGASAAEANSRLGMFKVPATASNVDYRHSFFSGLTDAADFDLDLAEFHQWMADNQRKPLAFATTANRVEWSDGKPQRISLPITVTPVAVLIDRRGGDMQVDNGYYFDDYDRDRFDDSGLTIVYDSDKQRVYMGRTTF